MIGRREPLPGGRGRRGRTPRAGTSRVTVSDQSGVRRFCWELTLERRMEPAIGHRRRRARGRCDIVWSKGRGVNGVRTTQRPAVLGELGVGLGRPGRDLAVPDRVDGLPRGVGGDGRGPGDLRGGARSGRSPRCLVAGQADQEADPGRAPRRARSCRGAGCRSGRRSGARRCPAARENARVSSTRGVQRLRARPMKSIREVRKPSGATVRGEDAHGLRVLVPGQDGMEAADVLHLGEQAVVLGVAPVGLGAVEDPLQVRHDLDRSRACPTGSRR